MEHDLEYDVLIIGAGAVGCAVARALSRYTARVAVLEQEADVAAGTSGRNSAVVHAGFNNRPGSRMAKLCVAGNQGFEALCNDLDVPYQKTGKLLVGFDEQDMATLRRLKAQGDTNGCRGLAMLTQAELHAKLPQMGGIGAMHSPETGIFDPFLYTVALAENAAANGVSFFFRAPVTQIRAIPGGWQVTAGGKAFTTRYLVNSAGLFSAQVAKLAGVGDYRIYPCRGEYFILDQIARDVLPLPVYPAPKQGAGGLGVHLTPTVHGNLLIGPSAEYIESPADTASTQPVLDELFRQAQRLLPGLERRQIIGAYAGIRPKQAPPGEGGYWDFVLREDRPGLIDLVGIESPGLSSAPAVCAMVADIVKNSLHLEDDPTFAPTRKGILDPKTLPFEERAALIKENPAYGQIICRCESVTEGEIIDAIHRVPGARSLDGVNRRTRAGMGRCQAGFCSPRVLEILSRELGVPQEQLTKSGGASFPIVGKTRKDGENA